MGLWDFLLDKKWERLDALLDESFSKVRKDTSTIAQWLKYLRQKDIQNDARHANISNKLQSHENHLRSLHLEIESLKAQISILKNTPKISPFPDQDRTRSEPKSEPQPHEKFSQRIIAQMRPVKKEYVLQQILSLISKESYSTKHIEMIVVKEKMLCGRTAFYDYLRELKHRNLIEESKSGQRRLLVLVSRR